MNFSQFFIKRPIFAAVLSLVILIGGAISLFQLPISEYPEVVPPTVVVRANFPGANPKVIGETVASPLEQAITGVEGMLYMSSQATADGKLTLTITFALGTDLDNAQVQVQNRVTRTMPTLPTEVQRLGVTVDKASPDLTMVVHLTSPDNRYDMLYLSNYAALNVKDELARLDGVGDVQLFGLGNYSLRVWLDPNKVAQRNLTATDVVNAIREQNRQVAAGALGAPPAPGATDFQLSINTQGRLVDEEEFENIIVRAGADGEITRLKDIARIELGSSQYALRSLLNNQPAVAIPIFQRPGSNAIAISDLVRERMAELKQSFPQGVDYEIVYDPTIFVRGSIEAVVHTLLEAIVLVVLVVILFLQTWRASIIPLAAVPVSLIGTFAVMHLLGFSLNALSLFGLVLAIGIVVDDAIVVVENVERNIGLGKSPVEATPPGHEGSHRADHRHRPGALRGVHPDCVHFRPYRAVLSAVRTDHRDFDGDLGVQLADPVAGAGCDPAQGPRCAEGRILTAARPAARRLAVPPVQPRVRPRQPWLRRRGAAHPARQRRGTAGLRRAGGPGLHGLCQHPDRLRSAAGQAIPGRLRPVAGRRHPGPHRGRDQAHVGNRRQASGRGEHRGLPGAVDQRFHQQPEQRHRLHPAQALR